MPVLAALVLAFTPGIKTPTGNITCFVGHGTLHCEIAQAFYRPALQSSCLRKTKLDWHGFEVSTARKASPTCSGGALYDSAPNYRTLPYGHVWRVGAISCTSRITGLTCTAGTHGVFVSRQSWRGW